MDMSPHTLTARIKAEALRIGFSACGVSEARKVDEKDAVAFLRWIGEGYNAGMGYMENYGEKRLDPTLLMPGAKSVISMALNYYPSQLLADGQYQFAYYAYGKDYHDVMKSMMRSLSAFIIDLYGMEDSVKMQLCCDTVPILDRYWAWRSGLGWIGKNTNLIIPHAGSFFFLCEILIDKVLDYDSPMPSHCGTCTRCLDACPVGALPEPYVLNANHCLSYLTIESREASLPPNSCLRSGGAYIYGCDRCQLACPHNRFACPTSVEAFTPSSRFLSMRPSDWHTLTLEQYRELFKGSAVKRAKYEGLMRNIRMFEDKDMTILE